MTQQEKNTWKKVGIGAAILLGSYFLFFRSKDEPGSGAVDPTGNVNTPGTGASSFNAANIANILYNAMKPCFGTDEKAIFQALQGLTEAQFEQVRIAFGRKSYNTTWGCQYVAIPWSDLPLLGLREWLKSELSERDYNTLRLRFPNKL